MKSTRLPIPVFRCALAMLAAVLTSCVEDPVPKLRIGSFQRPGFEPLFLARSLGLLDESRVELVEFPSASEMLLAYRNRAIDAALTTTDDVLRLAADGHDPRIVLVLAWSRGADALLTRPTITEISALRGQKVAVESNALGGYLLARALDTAGMTIADVKVVSVRSDRIFRELQLANVDAVVASEPYRARLIPRGVQPIYDTRQIPDDIADVLVIPASQAASRAAVLGAVRDAWYRALDYLAANESDATERMAPRHGGSLAQFQASLRLVSFVDRATARRLLGPADKTLDADMRRVADFMVRAQMLPGPVDPAPLRSDLLTREGAR